MRESRGSQLRELFSVSAGYAHLFTHSAQLITGAFGNQVLFGLLVVTPRGPAGIDG
jgi:hypothetical protein